MAETSEQKLHAACDECRTKKLKCSGEASGCQRCGREALRCNYSIRAPMGRPPKRRRGPSAQEVPQSVEQTDAVDEYSTGQFFDLNNNELNPNDMSFLDGLDHSIDFLSNGFHPDTPFANHEGPSNLFPETSPSATIGAATVAHSSFPEMPSDLLSNSTQSQCSCLTNALSASSGLDARWSLNGFPMALAPLKNALAQAQNIISCTACASTHSPISAWRVNTLYMITLLGSIACKFDELLRAVDREAALLESSNSKKTMRIGELSHHTAHLHTGTPDCPMGFEMELGAAEWRAMAFRAIMAVVSRSEENKATLINLVARLEIRQRVIHALKDKPDSNASNEHNEDSPTCVQLTKSIWQTIHGLPD